LNVVEADVIAAYVSALIRCGLPASDIALLTPFRAQVRGLRSRLEHLLNEAALSGAAPGLDICTIDQYQGKDKPCVIVSFVRSNDSREVGPLLKDWRRINVAITRARAKLVLVGSASTLAGGSHFLETMMQELGSESSVIPVDRIA
jgi:DNA replication ATP-dependent helicase Dna2